MLLFIKKNSDIILSFVYSHKRNLRKVHRILMIFALFHPGESTVGMGYHSLLSQVILFAMCTVLKIIAGMGAQAGGLVVVYGLFFRMLMSCKYLLTQHLTTSKT